MRSPRTIAAMLLAVAALLSTACTNSPDAVTSPSATASPPASTAPTGSTTPAPTPSATATASATGATASVRFSVLGDVGSSDATAAVLDSIAARDDDFTLAVGDLSYGRNGAEDTWCRFVARRVGPAHPVELVSGNHESDGPNGDIDRFARCLPNRLPGLVGSYGRQWYVDAPAGNPVVRVVMISPALDFGHGSWSYDDGTTHQQWLRAAVTGARAAGIAWVVVGMHKPCLTMGRYRCDPGTDVVDALLDTGVDLVLTGHEHLYQRSRPLALGTGCRTIRTGRLDGDCIAPDGRRGTTFVTVGTGGHDLRDVDTSDAERGYFAAWSGRNRQPSFGSLDVQVTADRLTASFVPVAGGTFTDRLVLTR